MKMELTGIQVFWMIMTMNLGMSLVMTITPALQVDSQDAWMSIIVACGIAMLVALLATQTSKLQPALTLVESSQKILGSWLGKLVIVTYIIQWYTIIPIVLRQFSDLAQVMLLQKTPKEAIIALMVLLIVYVTYIGGIEGVGRCSEFLGPIILIMVAVVLVANIFNVHGSQILPVYADSGMLKIVKGAFAPASYLGHSIEYLMLASFVKQQPHKSSYVFWAVLLASFMVLVTTVTIICTIGSTLASTMWYPFFELARKISLFGFIDNFDAVPVVVWIASVFIKLSVYFFVACYGTAKFLNIRNWRNLIWILAPVMFAFALIPQDVSQASTNYLINYWVPIALPINMLGLPLLLLVVGKWRQRRRKNRSRHA